MRRNKGFTLVELLIVIALIAILSVAVLATINPIEQTNKARDAKFKNDVAEVLAGYERYYAAQNKYPWNEAITTGGGTAWVAWADGDIGIIQGDEAGFGVLDTAGNPAGRLIETSELKSSFGAKEPFVAAATAVDEIYTYTNGSGGNYVCFCPKANANRIRTADLKCASGVGAADVLTNYDPTNSDCGDGNATVTPANFCTLAPTVANLLCVPEGAIQ